MDISQLENKTKEELLDIVKEMELPDCSNLEKLDLIRRLLQADAEQQGNIFSSGVCSSEASPHRSTSLTGGCAESKGAPSKGLMRAMRHLSAEILYWLASSVGR